MEELKEKYWRILSRTRKSGRISPNVKQKAEQGWARFDGDVIKEALEIHISSYPHYKENYTIGIMRNLQRQKEAGRTAVHKKAGSFNSGMKHDYDMDAIERQILAN